MNVSGEAVEAEADDLLARIWQHEVDHLDGRLVIDGMSEAAVIANRRVLQQLEADFAELARIYHADPDRTLSCVHPPRRQ